MELSPDLGDGLEALLAGSGYGVVAFDATGRIALASSLPPDTETGVDALLGGRVHEACGHDPRLTEALHRCWAGASDELTIELGPDLWEAQCRPLSAPDGSVIGGVLLLHLAGRAGAGARARAGAAARQPGGPGERRELRDAIQQGQLLLHYQPLVAVADQEPQEAEALVRWQHPSRGLVPPVEFIPVAERSGLVHDLGRWVLLEACGQAAALTGSGRGMRVSVNVSAKQLTEGHLVGDVTAALERTGCPPSALTIEVTETALTTDLVAARTTLQALSAMGLGLALDDFGTGYSSLLYLRHFPVDTLKIDRSFVSGLGTHTADTAIVASTISLAHSIGIRCVAEGVETDQQLALLGELGCDLAQGFLFSPPLDPEALGSWLTERPTPRARGVAARKVHDARILELHGQGASLHTIAAALNSSGARTPHGTRWHPRSVATVIARAVYPDLDLP